MMCISVSLLAGIIFGAVVINTSPAQARCRTVTQTHNGTDAFYSDGAAGTAAYKIRLAVAEWKEKTGIKRAKIGKIKTSCGKWFMKYGLPHKHCVAKASVCY